MQTVSYSQQKEKERKLAVSKIIKSNSIDIAFLRQLAGFQIGEIMLRANSDDIARYFTNLADDLSSDLKGFRFKKNMRNFLRRGYAAIDVHGIILTAIGKDYLLPYEKTTCILTGRRVRGEF